MRASLSRPLHGRLQSGMTLIEIVLFIVVIGVAGAVLLTVFVTPLAGSGTQSETVTAAQVAQARMEVVLGQKRKNGFPGSDPCEIDDSPSWCQLPADWSVSTAFEAWAEDLDIDRYQVIVVSAQGPDGSTHSIRALVAQLGG